MIELILLMLLAVTLFLMCLFVFLEGRTSKKFAGKSLFFIAVLCVTFAMIFKPQAFIRWDLIEHFKIVDNMRVGGLKYATTQSFYADLYVYNYFAYFISLLPKSLQNLLTAIPLAINFSVAGYIYRRTYNVHLPEANGKTRTLSVMMWLFTFGLMLAISGIRCSLAVSISVLAIYLEMIEKKKKPIPILLYIIAVFIHNFAMAVIAVRLLTLLKKPILIIVSSLGISLILAPIARFLVDRIDNSYFLFSFRRILETIESMGFSNAIKQDDGSAFVIHVCFVIIAVYLFVMGIKARRSDSEDVFCRGVANFATTVGAVAIGLSFNFLYLERFMFVIAFALLMVIPLRNQKKNSINAENLWLVPLSLFLFFFNNLYLFMVNYIGDYFLEL